MGNIEKVIYANAASNKGMHPTADMLPVKFLRGAARRVMPGVMLLHKD
jgi:hypothetical protein